MSIYEQSCKGETRRPKEMSATGYQMGFFLCRNWTHKLQADIYTLYSLLRAVQPDLLPLTIIPTKLPA